MSQKSNTHLPILIGGDLLVILSFVWIGRTNHNFSLTDVLAGLSTALPFIISWVLIVPWFGLYKAEVYLNWRKLIPRLLLAWAIAGPFALVLRALFLGRPIPYGIVLSFAAIAIIYIGLVVLIWRLGYMGWVNQHHRDAKESNP